LTVLVETVDWLCGKIVTVSKDEIVLIVLNAAHRIPANRASNAAIYRQLGNACIESRVTVFDPVAS
jgi:hypothetical protein